MLNRPLLFSGAKSYRVSETPVPPTPMTSNTAPAGYIASANDEGGEGQAYKAFDQSGSAGIAETSRWYTGTSGLPAWLQLKTPSPIVVGGFNIRAPENNYRLGTPGTFKFQGSTNGVSFTDLLSVSGLTWAAHQIRGFTIPPDNYASFLYHRLLITGNEGGGYATLNNLEIYPAIEI